MVQPADYKTVGVLKGNPPGSLNDKQVEKDRDAYKRLRKEGLQPPHIDGCAKLEQEAVTRDDITTGAISLPPSERRKAAKERRAAFDRARELTE